MNTIFICADELFRNGTTTVNENDIDAVIEKVKTWKFNDEAYTFGVALFGNGLAEIDIIEV